jgi:hypothetical protein
MTFTWPIPEPNWGYTNALTEMVLKDTDFYQLLDEEPLKIKGLEEGNYQLKINGQVVGAFSAKALHHGINLAEYDTPMLEQSYREQELVWKQIQWHFYAWHEIQLKLSGNADPAVQQAMDALVTVLNSQQQDLVNQQHAAAMPQPMHYELIPVKR